jgi:hypothetical protein
MPRFIDAGLVGFCALVLMESACASVNRPTQLGNITPESKLVPIQLVDGTPTLKQTITIANPFQRTLGVEWCGPDLERNISGKWETVRVAACAGSARPRLVSPGSSISLPFTISDDDGQLVLLGSKAKIVPGRYRFSFVTGFVNTAGVFVSDFKKTISSEFEVLPPPQF